MTEKQKRQSSTTCSKCSSIHFNNLWSVWYGALGGILQVCVALKCTKRLLNYSVLTWPSNLPLPVFEMNISLALTGAAILLIPFFVVTAIFKVGNLANDGHKLGRHLSACSKERASEQIASSSGCNCWKFGGPTGPFLHIVIAFCLMLPKLLMQARFIEAGFFPQEMIWRTDLNFMSLHKDRLVILNFMTLTSNDTSRNTFTKLSTEATLTTMNIEDNTIPDLSVEKSISSMSLASKVVNILKDYIGTDDRNYNVIEYERSNEISIEFINFSLALGIYAVRYASLFWATNKWLSLLFSVQLIINGIQILLSYAGVSILYKVQIMGGLKALPFFKHQIAKSVFTYNTTPFLLNSLVSILLYILYVLLIISSSLVFYLYGHIRFKNFLNQNCQRKVILLKEGNTSRWIYFTHCAALFLLIAIGVCSAPLFYDYTIVYRGSLNSTILFCIIGGILHLFLWIVLWLFLTIKQNWDFKLRISIGNASVKQSSSIKLAAEIFNTKKYDDNFEQPLLVASNGYVYSVTENNLKSDIVDILHKDLSKSSGRSADTLSSDDNSDNQIYWLKSELFDSRNSHFKHIKDKCTTEKPTSNICTHDDGDYATLKKPEGKEVDDITEVDKLLSEVHIMDISYANTNQDLIPIEEESKEDSTEHLIPNTSNNTAIESTNTVITLEPQKIQLHKCKRTTSIVQDDGITKYDSISMESSNSPPDHPDSETSSGVHSNESADHQVYNCNQQNTVFQENNKLPPKVVPAPTVPEQIRENLKWKSCSLHRCVRPETAENAVITNKYYSLNPNISMLQEQLLKKSICPHNLNQSKNASEDTLVICRKLQPFKLGENSSISAPSVDDPFGRSTNMRMSSFEHRFRNNHCTFSNVSFNSGNKNIYTQCPSSSVVQANFNGPNNISQTNALYQRQHTQHTTIPSHHNGVELYNNQGHQFVKN